MHANQVNPYVQLDASYAAQKAAAKQEAANIRKKLTEFASILTGESGSSEAGITKLHSREESQEQTAQQNPQKQGSREKQTQAPESGEAENSVSEWA